MKYSLQLIASFFITIVLLPYSNAAFCQQNSNDSFRRALQQSGNSIESADRILLYAEGLLNEEIADSSGIYWATEAAKRSEALQYVYGISKANELKASYYFSKSEWEKSIRSYEAALSTLNKIDAVSKRNEISFNGLIGLAEVYNYMGDYVTALDYRLKGLKMIDSIGADDSKRTSAYVSIANDFRHLNQRSKAIEYLEKAAPFVSGSKENLQLDYFYEYYQNLLLNEQIDESVKMLNRFDSAVNRFNLSTAQKLEFGGMAAKLHGQFELYHAKNYTSAVNFFKIYLDHNIRLDNKTHIAIAYNKLGIAFDSLKQYSNAIDAFNRSFEICMKEAIIDYAYKSAFELAGVYEKTGDFINAYKFSKEAFMLKDQLETETKLKELNFLEARYQATRKEKEIAELKVINTNKELAVVRRNRMLLIGGIGAASLLLILGLLYRNSRQRVVLAEKDRKLQQEQILFLERQQQVLSLQSMINGQETERTRIAKDLHDGLGGLFSTVKMYFSTLEHQLKLEGNELFKKSLGMVDTAAGEIRRIAHNMMPEVLMKMGLMNALQDLCNNISSGGILKVTLQQTEMHKRLGMDTEIMLYRIIQELLNNIIKHAHAKKAIVQFVRDGNRLSITVEDDGRGFDMSSVQNGSHVGMESVKSRVSYLNGQLNVDSRKDVGTTIMMDFLINEA